MESNDLKHSTDDDQKVESEVSKVREADWPTVLFFIHIHLLATYGIWLVFIEAKLLTILFLVTLVLLATLGVTTGAHRLWAHRTYTANTGLRIFLMLCQTLTGQGTIYDWAQSHRMHHEHFGTFGDIYNYNKGFIYAHFSTRLKKLSDYHLKLLDIVDMTDLEADSVVMFQKKFYWILYPLMFILLPINAPLEYWDDSVLSAIFVIGFLRYFLVLHLSWLVESAVCVWGLKHDDRYPPDTNMVFILNKSFWPKYHYLIPQDYKSGEYGTYDSGCSTAFIRVWAALGWAKDLRTAETTTVQRALAEAARTKRSIVDCIAEARAEQILPADHYLYRSALSA